MNQRKKISGFSTTVLGLLILASFCVISCSTAPPAPLPPDPARLTQEEKQQAYGDYVLAKEGSVFWGLYFLQGSGYEKYPYPQVRGLFGLASEDARAAYKKGSNYTRATLIAGGVGGFLIGYPLGGYLVTNEFDTGDYILMGAGAGFTVVSVITSLIADRAFENGVFAYNAYLRGLYLSAPKPEAPAAAPPTSPRLATSFSPWAVGGSLSTTGAFFVGEISNYFSPYLAVGLDLLVSYKNVILMPSAGTSLYGAFRTDFFYEGEFWAAAPDLTAGLGVEWLDLKLGYRSELTPQLAVGSYVGAGIVDVYERGAGHRMGFAPSASLGVFIERFNKKLSSPGRARGRLTAGIGYKLLLKPWDDRFKGSQMYLSLQWPGWVWSLPSPR
jgi:hypothetical protein